MLARRLLGERREGPGFMEGRDIRTEPRSGSLRHGPSGSGGAQPAPGGHQVILRAREQATIGGVLRVSSFDDHEIVLDTDLGTLTLLGHDLQIKQLDLAQGTFWVEGLIDSLAYAQTRKGDRRNGAERRGGMLGRLFR
jgi:sporulation protein YabP